MARKILIVYEKAGMGHLRMAGILQEVFRDDDVEITVAAGSELLNSKDTKLLVFLWNYFINKNWIRAADLLINFGLRLFLLPVSEVIQTPKLLKIIKGFNPEVIISTYDVYNRILGTYASEHKIPCFIMITEVAIFIDLVHPAATHICYFDETCRAVRSYDFKLTYFNEKLGRKISWAAGIRYILRYYYEFVIKGFRNSIYRNPDRDLPKLNQARCQAIGPLAEKKYFTVKDAAALKAKHGVPPGADSVMLVSGSLGGNFLGDIVKHLEKQCTRSLNLLVMCGNDNKAYERLANWEVKNPRLNIMPFAYTADFDEFLELADCAIIRPSAGVFTESLIKRTPVLTFKLASTNDRGSLTMINKYRLGEVCGHYRDLGRVLNTILDHKEFYRENIDKLLSQYPCDWDEQCAVLKQIILASPEQ